MDIIYLKPVLKECIWGGNRLASDFGYDAPSEHTGECWGISAHANGDCKVAGGQFDGITLSELWDEHRELFGNIDGERFPLLIKIIDAKDDLSIQVHPNDEYAKVNENGSFGKTECWYILDCEPDSTIVIGHNAKDHAEMKDMILNHRWNDFIRVIPIKKGDFFQINPGCLHAIKGGTLLLETQQNSDITYRVYDYDRLSNGKLRELHLEQSIAVIEAPFVPCDVSSEPVMHDSYTLQKFITCDYYTVEKLDVNGAATFLQDKPFINMSVIDGNGTINDEHVSKGMHFIIPNGYGEYTIEGNLSIIQSYV